MFITVISKNKTQYSLTVITVYFTLVLARVVPTGRILILAKASVTFFLVVHQALF